MAATVTDLLLTAGQVFESPRGTRVEILENSPERLAFTRALPPSTGGTKAKSHRHTTSLESFKLLDGEATGWVDGRERKLRAGEELEIPLGSTHINPYTVAGKTATLVQTVTPRSRAVEVYFTSWLGWLVQGKADANDEPTVMQLAAITKEAGFGGTWASGLPVFLQRAGLPLLGTAARMTGTRAVRVP